MHTPLKNSAASNHGLTSTSHHIWPNLCTKNLPPSNHGQPCEYPGLNKYVPPHLAQPMHTTINTETDMYMIFSRTDGPKKRALVQKI